MTIENAGVIAPPPLIVAAALLAGVGLDLLWPAPFLGRGAQWALGLLLVVPSVALILACARMFRRAGTAIEPWKPSTTLLAAGPYRRTRNPIYLAMIVGYVGLACAIDSLWIVALTPVPIALLHWGVVRREERYLEARFGEPYRDYCGRVRRWI